MIRECTTHYQRVRAFRVAAGQIVRDRPEMPTAEERLLCARLIYEEAMETVQALGCRVARDFDSGHLVVQLDPDDKHRATSQTRLAEIADGLADLSVVTTGAMVCCGIADEPLLRLVDESNMAKFNPPLCPDCQQPMEWNDTDNGWWCQVGPCGNVSPLPKEAGPWRDATGKLRKPESWVRPDFDGLLDGLRDGPPKPLK